MNEKKIRRIQKRTGEIVPFDQEKIKQAINKALRAVNKPNDRKASALTELVVLELDSRYDSKTVPTVEEIQDVVESILIRNGLVDTAKSYILYRAQRARIRESKSIFVDVNNTVVDYISKADWRVAENSNTDYSFSGLILHISGKVLAGYVLNNVYSDRIRDAHKQGYIHIHDLSHGIVSYCAGWSLKDLLLMGFGNVPNKADSYPAKHLSTAVGQMVNFLGVMQMEHAGAQAFNSVDTYLAPFVRADNLTYEQVKQCVQHLIYGLNIASRWGGQTPFTNLTFDLTVPEDLKDQQVIIGGKESDSSYGDYQKEMDMINLSFLELMEEGDAKGRIFTFPIPTYNLTKDFDWDSPIAQRIFEVTAKYGIPYFQNYIGSDLDPGAVRAMCCRLNIDQRELINRPGNIWGAGENTGSIGVTTINLNRIAYESATEKEFYRRLCYFMELARDSLERKRKVVNKNLKNGLMPYTKTYLGTLDNHFSTIGICGMNEACINLLGADISTDEGKQFSIKTLKFIRDKIQSFQQETGNLYNLEATPAESTAYRFGKLDKEKYPDIITAGTNDAPYLTNSTQLPVNATSDLFFALEHQNDIQPLYTGGTIFHTFLGERLPDTESCKNLVRKIAENTKLPYFSITPTFSICPSHGYIIGQYPICPEKGCNHETEVYSRIVGYFRPVKNWNIGKRQEFTDRITFKPDLRPGPEINENRTYLAAIEIESPESVKDSVEKVLLFTQPSCVRCFSVKDYLMGKVDQKLKEINAGTDSGLQTAQRYNIRATPTVIFLDNNEKILGKATSLMEVKEWV
ncbi:MAG: ribonucleoside triphosphate reductase [Promethearchaeota archaeon]